MIKVMKCPKCGKWEVKVTEFPLWECKKCRYFFKANDVIKYNYDLTNS